MTESLAEVLRYFRSAAHLSQEALAERSGLSTRTVSDIETGSARTPRLVTVMLLAEALGLSPEDRSHLQNAARKPADRPTESPGPPATALQAPALVGREADLARISALLSRNDARLVTLIGPAGVGKTSLAIRAAVERANAFEHAVVFVELAPIHEPSNVPAAVARALGITDSAETTAGEAVPTFLRGRNLLLVLDNLEHLTPAARWIGSLIAACPRLVVLATSREPLHLHAERVFAVRPLEKAAAVSLFVQRAQMVTPDFELTSTNAVAVDTIVEHLEGLPLAIELAAPRLSLLPAKALAARLERRLPLLGDASVDRPQRQQTMHGAIAWSYDLLSEDERRVFRSLSMLHGGGTLAAATAVVGDEDGERSILFRLAPLVDKNMLLLVEDPDAEPRVSMLEMLREYAHERLVESEELADAQRRHAAYVFEFAQGAQRELSGGAQAQWLARFELEHENIRAALQWLARSAETTVVGFQLIAVVWRFWWLRGYLNEGLAWVRRFLDLRTSAVGSVPDLLYAKVLRAQVVLLSALGSFDEALAPCEHAIELQRAIGDDAGLGASLTSLGIILQFRGEFDRAEEVHNESFAIRRRIGEELGVANSLSNLASIAFSKNDMPRTAELGSESVAIYRRLGHESGLAHALMKIGLVAAAEHNYAGAEELFNECLRVQRAAGDTTSVPYSLVNLGAVAHKRGNYQLAIDRYREALDLLESMPNKATLAKTLEDIAAAIAAAGDASRGARLLGAADTLRRAISLAVFPSERSDYDEAVANVRATLGDDAFEVQWRIGASSSLERAVEEARQR